MLKWKGEAELQRCTSTQLGKGTSVVSLTTVSPHLHVMPVTMLCLGSLQRLGIQQPHPPGDQGALHDGWYQQPSVARWNDAIAQPGMVIHVFFPPSMHVYVCTMFKNTCSLASYPGSSPTKKKRLGEEPGYEATCSYVYYFSQGEPDYSDQNSTMDFLQCSTAIIQTFKKNGWGCHPTHFLIHISKLVCFS